MEAIQQSFLGPCVNHFFSIIFIISESLFHAIEKAMTDRYLKYMYLASILKINITGVFKSQYNKTGKTKGKSCRKIQIMLTQACHKSREAIFKSLI